MIDIKMPGDAVEHIGENELLWMRKALADEHEDAIMLRVGSDRIFSSETLDDLRAKFKAAAVPLADFTAPEGPLDTVVNVRNVQAVEPANPKIHHAKARAVLRFARKLKLAVRETEKEAADKIAAASAPAPAAAARPRAKPRRAGTR
jgi:hypothetical protein